MFVVPRCLPPTCLPSYLPAQDRSHAERNKEALAGASRVVIKSHAGALAIPMNQGTVVRTGSAHNLHHSVPNSFRISAPVASKGAGEPRMFF